MYFISDVLYSCAFVILCISVVFLITSYQIHLTNMNLAQLREAGEDRRAWPALVHGVTKSWTQLNDETTTPSVLNVCLSKWSRSPHLQNLNSASNHTREQQRLFTPTEIAIQAMYLIAFMAHPWSN